MSKVSNLALTVLLSLAYSIAVAEEPPSVKQSWLSPGLSVEEKAKWASSFFVTNACTFADVLTLLGEPDSKSRTGTEVTGYSLQYDALYNFPNGTIDLVFLMRPGTEFVRSTLYKVRYRAYRTPTDLYSAVWREEKVESTQPTNTPAHSHAGEMKQ